MVCLSELLDRPLKVGNKEVSNRLMLAPMTALGHVAFREVLASLGGCGLMFSEMCSAARIPQENRWVSPCFRWRDAEAEQLSVQILGSDPRKMADAAKRIEDEGLFGVDINLGCSVTAVCRFGQGAGLLKNPDSAVEIIHRVRQTVRCPVSVKFRTGWQDDPAQPVALARRLEDAGADMLIFHPRVAPDRRNRPPRWEYIGLVKAAVTIPVIGNGDLFSAADCRKMMENTGCDGVALGRIAIARPWVFAQWLHDEDHFPGDLCRQTALDLLIRTREHFDAIRALRRYKRYLVYLAANFVFGNSIYNRLRHLTSFEAIETTLEDVFASDPQTLKKPNLNLMR